MEQTVDSCDGTKLVGAMTSDKLSQQPPYSLIFHENMHVYTRSIAGVIAVGFIGPLAMQYFSPCLIPPSAMSLQCKNLPVCKPYDTL